MEPVREEFRHLIGQVRGTPDPGEDGRLLGMRDLMDLQTPRGRLGDDPRFLESLTDAQIFLDRKQKGGRRRLLAPLQILHRAFVKNVAHLDMQAREAKRVIDLQMAKAKGALE